MTDSLVLIADIISESGLSNVNDVVCKVRFVKYSVRGFSAYIVAVIAIQRFVMVKMPFKGKKYDKTKCGIYHLISAFIFAFGSSAFAVPTMGVFDGRCRIYPGSSIIFTYSYLSLIFSLFKCWSWNP